MSMLFKKLSVETMRQCFIDELAEKGITAVNGKSIHEATNDDLKQELALLPYRQIDIESPENKFF